MDAHSKAAMEGAMKIQEVILRAMAKKIPWCQAAEILGFSDRHLRRVRERYEQFGYESMFDNVAGSLRRSECLSVRGLSGGEARPRVQPEDPWMERSGERSRTLRLRPVARRRRSAKSVWQFWSWQAGRNKPFGSKVELTWL